MSLKTRQLAKSARFYRRLHKYIAIPMILFMFLLGSTGLLLAWKSELKLQPSSQQVENMHRELISLNTIQKKAISYTDSLNLSSKIDRIDFRPTKGIVKVRFSEHFTELQINCFTGEIISAKQRTDSIIEMIHDGSILDFLFGNTTENMKLLYSTITSLALIFLAFSGFWLWYKPKRIRYYKTQKH